MKFRVGQTVKFSNITHDELDRPVRSRATLKILEIAEPGITRYDYKVQAIKSLNIFYLKEDEIESLSR